jgi:hypothetical protein
MRRLLRPPAILAGFVACWFLFLLVLALCGMPGGLPGRCLERVKRLRVVRIVSQRLSRDQPLTTATASSPVASSPAPVTPEEHALPPVVDGSLRFVVPPQFYAVPGVEMSLYFDNIVLSRWFERLKFEVACDIGHTERRRWVVIPSPRDVGRHPVRVIIKDLKDKELGRAETVLRVLPEDAGAGESSRMLFVGDCWVHHAAPLNALARLLDRPNNPNWTMLGTHVTPECLPKVRHEGYGGWTWYYFLTFDRPKGAKELGLYRDRSPFLFPAEGGGVRLDVARYFKESCEGRPPQVTFFVLGSNDVYAGEPDKAGELGARVAQVLEDADALIAEFRRAAPSMTIAVVIPSQLSAFERIYVDFHGPEYSRWRVRQNYHRYQEGALAHFAGREKDNIHVVPVHLSVDAIDAFSGDGDPGALNDLGGRQVAAGLYAWLKYWYTQRR